MQHIPGVGVQHGVVVVPVLDILRPPQVPPLFVFCGHMQHVWLKEEWVSWR